MPSRQIQTYLQMRASNATVEQACAQSGIGAGEAQLWEADIASGEVELPCVDFSARPSGDENRQGTPRAHVHVHEGDQSTMEDDVAREDVKTSIKVGDGPEVPIDLDKGIDHPENAAAKEAISGVVASAIGKPATATGEQLKRYIERAECLDAEIKDLNSDKSELFKEMKGNGFDTATIKRIIKLRKMETHQRQEAEALLETYMNALGMTPIEHAIAMAA